MLYLLWFVRKYTLDILGHLLLYLVQRERTEPADRKYTLTFTPLFSLAWTCWLEIYLEYTLICTPIFSLAWTCWPEIYLGYTRTFTPQFSSAWTCWPEIYLGYTRAYPLLFRWVCSYTCCGLPGNKTGRPFSYFRPEGTLINKTRVIQGYPQLVRL